MNPQWLSADANATARALVSTLLDAENIVAPGPEVDGLMLGMLEAMRTPPIPLPATVAELSAELTQRAHRLILTALYCAQVAAQAIQAAEAGGVPMDDFRADLVSPYRL